jgi:hypothetical protein
MPRCEVYLRRLERPRRLRAALLGVGLLVALNVASAVAALLST